MSWSDNGDADTLRAPLIQLTIKRGFHPPLGRFCNPIRQMDKKSKPRGDHERVSMGPLDEMKFPRKASIWPDGKW